MVKVTPSNNREPWYDNVKSLLIIIVIIGHFCLPFEHKNYLAHFFRQVVFLFNMPLFLIITGILAKNKIVNKKIKDIMSRLFLPYLICNFIMFIIFIKLDVKTVSGILQTGRFEPFQPYYALWFLLAIFLYYLVTILLQNVKHLLLYTLLIAIISGFGVPITYMWLSKCIPLYLFFLIGYKVSDYMNEVKKILVTRKARMFSIILLCLCILLEIKYPQYLNIGILSMDVQYAQYPCSLWIAPLLRVGVLIIELIASFTFLSLIKTKQNFITYIGQYSLYPYTLHTFLMPFMFYSVNRQLFYRIDTVVEFGIGVIGCFLIALILSSRPIREVFKYILEPKF